jgi:hypothetical protein
MAGGGGRCGLLLFAPFVPHLACVHPALLPMAAEYISTVDFINTDSLFRKMRKNVF